ncbi:thrombin-like enzyme BjussuSP-1 [Symsagittifera roscoffensis]|uniref:thrombin-like enzyme BjussuSP-1 n=1 Tax=Symsagittifera roscoffensis TaxID=84072 RepID=UPI00307C3F7F
MEKIGPKFSVMIAVSFILLNLLDFGEVSGHRLSRKHRKSKRMEQNILTDLPRLVGSSGVQSSIINGINSQCKPFYVRIDVRENPDALVPSYFCGGTIVDRRWVMTAANCVQNYKFDQIRVKEFNCWYDAIHTSHVEAVFIAPNFQQRPKRRNDIALIKVKTHYPDHRVMPICQVEPELGTILGSCGLGSTSAPKLTIPTHIQEVFFYESMFENIDPFNFETCAPGNVCTDTVTDDSNICVGDEGNPLYSFSCQTSISPHCLYGVASYFLPLTHPQQMATCKDGSVYASVIPHTDWVFQTMLLN